MYDFDKQREEFKDRRKEFDHDFKRAKKWALITSIVSLVVALAGMGFVIWVVVMVMRFFGVV